MNAAVSATRVNAMLTAAVTHHDAGRFLKALPHFRKYLKRRPDDVAALNMASFAAFQTDHADIALNWLNMAKATDPNDAQTFYNLGLVNQSVGLCEDAANAYHRAAELDPDFGSAHFNLGTTLTQLDRLEDAIAAFDRAIGINPEHGKALSSKGYVLHTQGKYDEAAFVYGRAVSILFGDPEPLIGLGKCLQDAGRLAEAASAFARAVDANPHDAEAISNLANVMVQRGDAEDAVATCDVFLAHHPASTSVLAAKSVALNETGNTDAARQLVDLERFVTPIRQLHAPGFKNMEIFNAAMVGHAENHPTLAVAPTSHATRLGKHSADLTAKPKGPVAAFEKMIGRGVEEFIERLGSSSEHPFIAHRPRKWHLAVWAIVLEGKGYQVSHIHRSAWLSGVYYAQVPSVVDGKGQRGWIEFGEPGPEYHSSVKPETRRIKPEPGLMVLFPSYTFHRTIPFESDETRISIAFDVVPDI